MAATPAGMTVDRRMRPHAGPRERRSGDDRRQEHREVLVERRRGIDRRVSMRSRAELWQRRVTA
jgi:hypothetical protein